MLVLGIDPDLHGALALYDGAKCLGIFDMPIWHLTVGKTKRPRLDTVESGNIIQFCYDLGVELAVLEEVNGRPKQAATANFVQGYTLGVIYAQVTGAKIPCEAVPPTVWKRVMRIKGKRGESGDKDQIDEIMARADELFPDERQRFRGPRGGKMHGRAEALLLAKFGCEYVAHNIKQMEPTLGTKKALLSKR